MLFPPTEMKNIFEMFIWWCHFSIEQKNLLFQKIYCPRTKGLIVPNKIRPPPWRSLMNPHNHPRHLPWPSAVILWRHSRECNSFILWRHSCHSDYLRLRRHCIGYFYGKRFASPIGRIFILAFTTVPLKKPKLSQVHLYTCTTVESKRFYTTRGQLFFLTYYLR